MSVFRRSEAADGFSDPRSTTISRPEKLVCASRVDLAMIKNVAALSVPCPCGARVGAYCAERRRYLETMR